MSHVLVSYKREDELRVARLIRALQQHGLIIWWDQGLPGAEEWRKNIHEALEKAGCVIVVWTEGSVGPEGGFVRDEASRALARGVLVPVRLDKVNPPLGFGELQAIDLTHWKSNPNDPFLLDLVALCKAKLEGKPAPAPKGPTQRLMRRAAAGSGGFVLAALAIALAVNAFHVQNDLCRVPGPQPALSDFCGALHLGEAPSHDERVAWENRARGSCEALRNHIARFPNGAYRSEAADLLQGAKVSQAATLTPTTRNARGYVRQSEHGFPTVDAAKADALTRAKADAMQVVCATGGADDKVTGADITGNSFDCRPSPLGGQVCADDYAAVCHVQTRGLTETCGG